MKNQLHRLKVTTCNTKQARIFQLLLELVNLPMLALLSSILLNASSVSTNNCAICCCLVGFLCWIGAATSELLLFSWLLFSFCWWLRSASMNSFIFNNSNSWDSGSKSRRLSAKEFAFFEPPPLFLLFLLCRLGFAGNQESFRTLPQLKPCGTTNGTRRIVNLWVTTAGKGGDSITKIKHSLLTNSSNSFWHSGRSLIKSPR